MRPRILAEGNDIHLILQVCTKHGLNRPKERGTNNLVI